MEKTVRNTKARRLAKILLGLLAAAAAFGGGYGLNALISKTPVLRWCVLGKRKEKRHVSG